MNLFPTFDEFQIGDIIKLAPFLKGPSSTQSAPGSMQRKKANQTKAGVTRYITREGERDAEREGKREIRREKEMLNDSC